MRAVILPLNEFIYNFEKYDGSRRGDRFDRNHPDLIKFSNTKAGEWVMKYCIALPIFILLVVLFFLPAYLLFLIRCGHKKNKSKLNAILDRMDDKANAVINKKRKDVRFMLNRCLTDNAFIFVYYTPEMIPKKTRQRKRFYEKLALMKKGLNIFHVQLVNKKEDVETMIWLFDIDRVEYFLMNLQLEISSPELLIPLGLIHEIFNDREMVTCQGYPIG